MARVLRAAIDGEVQRVTQQLAGRVKELEERYAQPLPAAGARGGGVQRQGRGAPEEDGAGVEMK